MKVMIIGGGGREHAILKKLKGNPSITALYALPGNGGMEADAVCVPIGAKDLDGITRFAKETGIGFAVVAPDDPLVLGAVDALHALGISCFGPDKRAALIEGSKVFSKQLMQKYGIPTASYEVFDEIGAALAYLDDCSFPAVIKADGLALGKGVILAQTWDEGIAAVRAIMEDKQFGESGNRIVIEEFLIGPEVSVLTFTDGKTIIPMVSSMDHKRAQDGDQGLNTGGMGAVAPNPYYTDEIAAVCMKTIFLPTIRAMEAEGRPFRGCLYFGLMLTEEGPKVIEYNCRFGDPEAQVVLPLLESDLFEIMQATAEGRLSEIDVRFSCRSACCVVIASKGYPVQYESGFAINLPPNDPDTDIYIAGASRTDGKLYSAGGRVLSVVAVADTLCDAVSRAYEHADKVRFENGYCRRDIGAWALRALEQEA